MKKKQAEEGKEKDYNKDYKTLWLLERGKRFDLEDKAQELREALIKFLGLDDERFS